MESSARGRDRRTLPTPAASQGPLYAVAHRSVITNPRPSTTRDAGGVSEIIETKMGFCLPAWVKGPSASQVKNASRVSSPSGVCI